MELGRYRLLKQLASSATTEAFLATTNVDGVEKTLELERPINDPSAANTFIEDAKVALTLVHPAIVRTFELVSSGTTHYVTRETVDGIDMLGLLRELAREGRRVDVYVAAWIMHELLDALAHAHALDHVHGKISMSNVMLAVDGAVKLGGFGAIRPFDLSKPHDLTHTSPEHVNGQSIDARSDVFVAGILLGELLIGRRLFLAGHELDVLVKVRDADLERFEAQVEGIDAALLDIVRNALRKHPADRWPSAAAFRDALQGWLAAHGRGLLRRDVAGLVAEVRAAHERSGGGPVADVDVRYQRAATIPPELAASVAARKTSRTPGQGVPMMKIVTIPERTAQGLGAIRKLSIAPATPAKPETATPPTQSDVYVDPLAQPETPIAALPTPAAAPAPVTPAASMVLAAAPPPAVAAEPPVLESAIADDRLLAPEHVVAARATHSVIVELDRDPDEAGSLAQRSPIQVMFKIMAARATGVLAVAHGTTRKTFHFRDGQPQSVWSNEPADLFGAYLIGKNTLDELRLQAALDQMTQQGGDLGATLVALGLVDFVAAQRFMKAHISARIIDLGTWTDGRYGWFKGTQEESEAHPLEGDSFAMLGEAALALGDDTIEAWLATRGEMTPDVGRANRVSPTRFMIDGLTDLYDALDGDRSINMLLTREPDRIVRARLSRMLYLLVTCELVR